MTVTQVLTAAKNNLNAESDTLWSESELLISLYLVCLEMARETNCIESTSTSITSTASTATYTKPTRALDIFRVTYSGTKLQQIDLREMDAMFTNSSASGTPVFYSFFNDTITLYPTPSASSDTIKVWSYNEPATISISSTIEIPSIYHDILVDGLTHRMCPKDLGHPLTTFWGARWNIGLQKMVTDLKKRKRGDRFAVVKAEENLITSQQGMV